MNQFILDLPEFKDKPKKKHDDSMSSKSRSSESSDDKREKKKALNVTRLFTDEEVLDIEEMQDRDVFEDV